MHHEKSSRKFSRWSVMSAALVLFCSVGPALMRADTSSESIDFLFNQDSDPAGLQLNFAPFNASLGNLLSVAITVDASRRHEWALWKNAPPAGPVHISSALLSGTTLSLDSSLFSFADVEYGPIDTTVLAPVSVPTFGSESDAGTDVFLLGNHPNFPSAYQGGSVRTLTGGLLPTTFDGTLNIGFNPGTLDVNYDAGSFEIAAKNFFSTSLVEVSGAATITYTYRVPELPAGWILPLSLAGVVLLRARRPRPPVRA